MEGTSREARRTHKMLATKWEKAYMAIAVFEAVVVSGVVIAGFTLVQIHITNPNTTTRTVPVYLANFLFAQLFSVVYVFDALRQRNIIQLVLHLFLNICIFIYSILQIPQTENALSKAAPGGCGSLPCVGPGSLYELLEKIYIANPVILGVCTVAFCLLVRKLHIEFGWAVFHLVHASPEMKRMHREYETLLSLLKLIFFFGTAFCLAYLILLTHIKRDVGDFVISILALVLTPITILATGWAARRENKPVMASCIFVMVAGLVYFIYRLASLFLPKNRSLYNNTRITMAIFSVFAILTLMATFGFGCLCLSNFGKGLIEAHQTPHKRSSLWTLASNPRAPEKVRADFEAEQPQPNDRLVID